MCERIPLHHLRCAYHGGGVGVIPFTCVLPALPQVPTPSSAILATSAALPARRAAPVRTESLCGAVRCGTSKQKATLPLPHTYAYCHSLSLAHTNTGSQKLPSAGRNDVALLYRPSVSPSPAYNAPGQVGSKRGAPCRGKCQVLLLAAAAKNGVIVSEPCAVMAALFAAN